MPADEQTGRDLITRGRQIRTDAHVPRDILAGYIGLPAGLLRDWETRAPDPGRLSYRDRLAVARWRNLLEQLDRETAR